MNVIRFPGYLVPDDRNGAWHGGEFYKSFAEMVRTLSERERDRMTRWHIKREGRANYRASVLCSYAQLDRTVAMKGGVA